MIYCSYVKFLVFFSLPIATIIGITLGLSSAYLEEISVPVYLIGIIAFTASMITAYVSKKAYKIEKKNREKKSLFFIQFLAIISVFLMALMVKYIGVLFYLLIPLVAGFFQVVINNYINLHIDTTHRATMISIKNLGENLGIFILYPIIGYIIKYKTMSAACQIASDHHQS